MYERSGICLRNSATSWEILSVESLFVSLNFADRGGSCTIVPLAEGSCIIVSLGAVGGGSKPDSFGADGCSCLDPGINSRLDISPWRSFALSGFSSCESFSGGRNTFPRKSGESVVLNLEIQL